MKAATHMIKYKQEVKHISIHAAREGGDVLIFLHSRAVRISIHAAREGGDLIFFGGMSVGSISIHAAREGGDCIQRG